MDAIDVPKLTRDELMEAITEGVRQAVWQMITNATDMPCHDFYDAVGDGVERAHMRLLESKP